MRVVSHFLFAALVTGLLAYASLATAQQSNPASGQRSSSAQPQQHQGQPSHAQAQPSQPNQPAAHSSQANQPQGSQHPSNQATFFGVGIERLSPAMASHFPGTIGKDQGLLVVDVVGGSPAEQAGVKPHDILLSLNDQKLTSPEQLIKLVQAAKPGQEATFQVLRQGKQESVKVKFAARSPDQVFGPQGQSRRAYRMPGMPGQFPGQPGSAAGGQTGFETLDSLTLKSLGNNRFRADVQFFSSSGKTDHRTFEGTREEIFSAVNKAQDMPGAERHLVLQSLGFREMSGPQPPF